MRRRRKRQIVYVQEHEFYETPSGNAFAYGGDVDTSYPAGFPVRQGVDMTQASNYQHFGSPVGRITDTFDQEIGGEPGQTKFNGTMGITDPSTVDAHNFQGQTADVHRLPDWHDGPVVGGPDHNALLPILYAMQESSRYYPQEVVQADLLKAV